MDNFGGVVFAFIVGIFIFVICFICYNLDYGNEQTYTCKVNDKWTKNVDGDGKYLVNCGSKVYEISDLTFKGKFNSADLYANLKKGKTYKITTTGYRFGFFSSYQNINEYEEVK